MSQTIDAGAIPAALDSAGDQQAWPLTSPGQSAQDAARRASFAEFYEEHVAFVWRNAERLLGFDSAADDVCQEVFVVAFRRGPEFEGRCSAQTWLFGILRNIVQHYRRAHRRRAIRDSADFDAIPVDTGGGQHASAENAEAFRLVYAILEKLDDNKREVFVLAELEQMTAPEIAIATSTNVTTVYARLRDAREQFATLARRYRLRQQGERP